MKNLKNKLLVGVFAVSTLISSCDLFKMIGNYPMEKDGVYNGIVVYVHDDEGEEVTELKQRIINFCLNCTQKNGDGEIDSYSLNGWYQKQAKNHNKNIEVILDAYPENILLPKYLNEELNGWDIIDLYDTREFLEEYDPTLAEYDFITLVKMQEDGNPAGFTANYARTNIVYVDGRVYYSIFAHEFAHLLGARDKYNDNFTEDNELMNNANHIPNLTDELFLV